MSKQPLSVLAALTLTQNYVSHETIKALIQAEANRARLPRLQTKAQHDNRRGCSGAAVLHVGGAAPICPPCLRGAPDRSEMCLSLRGRCQHRVDGQLPGQCEG